jgi:carboxyl-terminal processing protease
LFRDKLTNQLVAGLSELESPASKAGILPGDVVLSINGYITQDMHEYEASNLLSGVAGTSVVLRVRRGSQDLEFTARRSTQKSLPLYAISQTTKWGKIGYIRFMNFGSEASSLMRTSILNFEKEQVSGYILDLRANPGGLLYVSVDIVRMWLQSGTILSTISRQDEDRAQANQRALTNKPLVILVDGQSAAASEITASALQENQRAVLVGTPTYGLSSLQSIRRLGDGSGLAVTVAKWLTSKGRDIEKTGIVPDVVVKLTQTEQQDLIRQRNLGTLADPQYAKALQILSQQIKGSV